MKTEKMLFSKVPRGSKIIDFEVVWPDGSQWYTARKFDKNSVQLLDHKEKGVLVLVEHNREVTVSEAPHEDGDFSYLCNGEWCRCSQ